MKLCPRCANFLPESSFRYIAYFDARRSICTKCEARGRRRIKREAAAITNESIEKYGLTPKVWSRLNEKAREDARLAAQNEILAKIDPKTRRAYSIASFVSFLPVIGRKYVEPIDEMVARRAEELRRKILEEKRRERIEYEQFYSTTEWKALRDRFLRSQKKTFGCYTCYLCNQPIVSASEVSVDHRKPRSRYPELSLEISNLGVAHFSCNSSKGSKDF